MRHVSAGTWEWVRSMYGLAMHQTGAELTAERHLQVFDQALEARDRQLVRDTREETLRNVKRFIEARPGMTVESLVDAINALVAQPGEVPAGPLTPDL